MYHQKEIKLKKITGADDRETTEKINREIIWKTKTHNVGRMFSF